MDVEIGPLMVEALVIGERVVGAGIVVDERGIPRKFFEQKIGKDFDIVIISFVWVGDILGDIVRVYSV